MELVRFAGSESPRASLAMQEAGLDAMLSVEPMEGFNMIRLG